MARKLLVYTPDWAIYELEKYLEYLRGKLVKKGFSPLLLEFLEIELFNIVIVIPRELFRDKISEALDIARMFDEKDTPFIALALKLGLPIWTEDKDILKYSFLTRKYIALDTKAIEELLEGKSLEEALKGLKDRLNL